MYGLLKRMDGSIRRAFPYMRQLRGCRVSHLSVTLMRAVYQSRTGEGKVVRYRVMVAGRRVISAIRDLVILTLVFASRYSAQHLDQGVNVVDAVISPETDANHSWFSGFVSGE